MKPTAHAAGWLSALLLGSAAFARPARAQETGVLDRISSGPIPETAGRAARLAPGSPPLTQEMVDRFNLFFEWLLEAPTTQAQRDQLKGYLVGVWKSANRECIDGATRAVRLQTELDQKSEADREYIRQRVRPLYLEGLRKSPNDLSAQWALGLYDAAHKPIVPGDPPLTRQICDAFAEVLYFMHKEVTGESITLNQTARDLFARQMVSVYKKSNAPRRKHFADMPEMWAWIRSVWPRLEESEKETYRSQWRAYLKGMAPELAKPCLVQRTSPANAASAGLSGSHSDYLFVSNLSMMSHYSTMNAISNLSSGWRYEYRYR